MKHVTPFAGCSQAPPRPAKLKLPPRDVAIEARGLSYTPPNSKRPALRDIDLDIGAGEAVGIVGPSGAGKSCLARLITAVNDPTEGRLTLGGIEGRLWTPEDLARTIGYLPQSVGLFPGTIRDNICRFTPPRIARWSRRLSEPMSTT